MEPVINLQENPGRVVGRRKARKQTLGLQGETKAEIRAWRKAFPTLFIPKGVYRFNSHEDADAWMWKMITRPKS